MHLDDQLIFRGEIARYQIDPMGSYSCLVLIMSLYRASGGLVGGAEAFGEVGVLCSPRVLSWCLWCPDHPVHNR